MYNTNELEFIPIIRGKFQDDIIREERKKATYKKYKRIAIGVAGLIAWTALLVHQVGARAEKAYAKAQIPAYYSVNAEYQGGNIFTDENGEEWRYQVENVAFNRNAQVTIYMYSNQTLDVTDDEIITVVAVENAKYTKIR